jgi:RNA polymerase sigma-70 factor (ECF subfamily)
VDDVKPGVDRLPGGADVAALVERARARDGAAFRELFRLHVGRVHRLVYRLVGPAADIEDLVQTVFVEGFRSLPTFRGEALFSTWLGRIAVRVTLRARPRPALRFVPLDAGLEQADAAPGPEGRADARAALARLDRILDQLSAKRRAAFVLHVLEGYALEEVAAMVGANLSAVKVRIHDARREIERRAASDPGLAPWLVGKEASP